MSEISGATALLTALEKEKVEYIFGLPGGANLPIYDALVGANLRHILVRHEQSAAHMADGYARIKRKSGVLCDIRPWCHQSHHGHRHSIRRLVADGSSNRAGAAPHDRQGRLPRD